jgi:alpha-ketoglutarate-dependent 2,4-dichlorophenoxyacetate dioxygenase
VTVADGPLCEPLSPVAENHRRLSPAGGVEIAGRDLSRPLSPAAVEAIRQALHRHQFIVFPDQRLGRERQFAVAAHFGEVEAHAARGAAAKRYAVAHITANLDENGRPSARFAAGANYRWHTDKPYNAAPPALTTLYAVELPPSGGDTEFANTALAYESLSAATKARLAALRVIFRSQYHPAQRPVDHPLVRTHPQTGQKALYLGHHALGIAGMPEAEGRALLAELLAHATRAEFVHSHRWRAGDFVIWDNCCLLHRAVANYDMTRWRRVMHRSVVRGTVPF